MPLGRLRITYTGGHGPLGSDRGDQGPTLVVALGETARRPDSTAVITVLENLARSDDPELRGVFHMTGTGEASWADFAEAIFVASAAANGPSARVRRISTSDYPTPAKRPANSRLDSSKLSRIHGVQLPDWRTSTKEVVTRLVPSNGEAV